MDDNKVNSYEYNDNITEEKIENNSTSEEYNYVQEQVPQWQPDTRNYFDEVPKQKKEKKKKPVTMGKVFALCAVMMVITLVANVFVSAYAFKHFYGKDYVTRVDVTKMTVKNTKDTLIENVGHSDLVESGEVEISQVVDAVMPSVVAITSTSIINSSYNPFYSGGSYQVSGAGSGIIIGMNETELLIVTNNHVVDNTTSLTIQFCNDESVEGAYIKGTDSENDLAVVALPLAELSDNVIASISIASLGESDDLKIGETVIAIGNALGYGQSVTKGIVSALDRVISLESGDMKVIQTDAAINGGNSGGALVNLSGEVIGINVAKSSSSSSSSSSVEGMGYAIPVSQVKDIIDELMNRETRFPVDEEDRGYLGITSNTVLQVDSEVSEMYGIPEGIYIRELDENSALYEAGIKEKSVIVKINGIRIKNWDDMAEEISYYEAGETITVTVSVMGNGKFEEQDFDVKLKSYDEVN